MQENKVKKILSAAMICIFIVLISMAVLLQVLDFSHKSYIAAFAVSICLFVLFIKFFKKLPVIENIWVLILLSLTVNGLWVFLFRVAPSGDYAIFWQYANMLYYNYGVLDYIALFPHIFGYSFFLSRFLQIFGCYEIVPSIINVVLSTISGVLIWYLVKEHYGSKNGCLAFLIWILCPSKTIYNSMILSEPLYTCLLILFIGIVYIVSKQTKLYAVIILSVVSSLLLRFINCVRPIAIIPIIACLLWILFLGGFKKTNVIYFIIMVLLYIPTGKMWTNYITPYIGEEPASSLPGYNIYVGLDSQHNGVHNQEDMNKLLSYYYSGSSATDSQNAMFDEAIDLIKSGNIDYLHLIPSKLKTFLGNDEGGAFYYYEATESDAYSFLCIMSNIWYYFVVLLCIFSSVLLLKNNPLNVLQLCPLYSIGLTLAHMIVEVSGRYHYSIIPMLIIVACSFNKNTASPS